MPAGVFLMVAGTSSELAHPPLIPH